MKPDLTRSAVLVLLLFGFMAYVGNYHFYYGSKVDFQKIHKVSWSLSETLVNVDEVRAMPLFMARAKYPLFLQAFEAAKE